MKRYRDSRTDQLGDALNRQLKEQLEAGLPVPFLMLKHKDSRRFQDFIWHWFLLTGYDTAGDSCMAKAVTYGEWQWLDMDELWDTGFEKKGGLILYDMD